MTEDIRHDEDVHAESHSHIPELHHEPHHAPHSAPRDMGFFDGNPKMIFVFGLVAGIALTYLGGDLSSFNSRAQAAGSGDVAIVADAGDTAAAADTTPKVLAAVTDTDHIRGDIKKAKVVMIEYSDYQCPFCERHHPTMKALEEKYGNDVAWVYRHFPLSFHPNAKPAALAAECASEQGKFWEFTDAMYVSQDKLGAGFYTETAKGLGLDMTKFQGCVDTSRYASVVNGDQKTGAAAGVNGTPATFINGQLVSGAVDQSTFEELIDAALAK